MFLHTITVNQQYLLLIFQKYIKFLAKHTKYLLAHGNVWV